MSEIDPNHHGITDEQLDLHASALRDEPVPEDGPSSAALDATLAMLCSQGEGTGRRSFWERTLAMMPVRRIAAAALIILCLNVLVIVVFRLDPLGGSVAFADVADKLKGAKTIQYTSTTTIDGKTIAIRTLAAEPDRMRTEMPDGTVIISRDGVALTLYPAMRTASRVVLNGRPAPGIGGSVDAMRSLGQRGGEPLGEREIDGVKVVGFRTEGTPGPCTVWADKKTAAPVRIETNIFVNGGEAPMVIDKFVLDAPLDEKLFSLDPPNGYTVKEKTLTLPKIGELAEDVAELLRVYSDAKDGAFPVDLTDWAGINAAFKQDPQVAMKMGTIAGRLFGLPDGHGYAGKDVRRGEKDKVVFWFKNASGTYRAVYGDLRVADLPASELPKTPMRKPASTQPARK